MKNSFKSVFVVCAVATLCVAQISETNIPHFEVASVKLIKPGTPDREDRVLPSGRVELYDSVEDMIQFAYTVEDYMILGAPKDAGWHIHGVVAMGYPTGKWGVGSRKSVHEVAARNSWQGDLGFSVPGLQVHLHAADRDRGLGDVRAR